MLSETRQIAERRHPKAVLAPESYESYLVELTDRLSGGRDDIRCRQLDFELRGLTRVLNVDRGSFLELVGSDDLVHMVHSPMRSSSFGVEDGEVERMPWLTRTMRAADIARLPNLAEDLPESALRERRYFEALGLRSLLLVPLTGAQDSRYALAVGNCRSVSRWESKLVERIRVAGALILQRMERRRAERELQLARAEICKLRRRIASGGTPTRDAPCTNDESADIVGRSKAFRAVLERARQVAPTEASVLLLGETGTGKELVAQAVHAASKRSQGPLVKVNCAALPATLIESELFGHERGAFTGATSRKIGRFEQADGGTLFLDEIGDLPIDLQAKLLRVLQAGEFERLGSTSTIRVDVRVVAATNRDLEKAMRAGTFREDLFFRLGVFPLRLPPLRERLEDIPYLVSYFLTRNRGRLGKEITSVPDRVIRRLQGYSWPGNVRELENTVERAMILSAGSVLQLEDCLSAGRASGNAHTSADALAERERRHILDVLERCDWKVKGRGNAAERLELKPSTLRFRMRKLGIERPRRDANREE